MTIYNLTTKLINYISTNNTRYIFNTNYLCSDIINFLFICYELQTTKYVFITVLNGEYRLHNGNLYMSQYIQYLFKPILKYIDNILYIYYKQQYVPVYCAFDGDSVYLLITKIGYIIIPKLFIDNTLIDNLVVLKVSVIALPVLNYTCIDNNLIFSIKSINKKPYMTTENIEDFMIETPICIYIYDKTIIPVYITVQQRDNLDCDCETQCPSVILYYNDRETIVYYCKNNQIETLVFDCLCYASV